MMKREATTQQNPGTCQKCGNTEGFVVEWHPTPGIIQSGWFCPHCWAKERAEREEILSALAPLVKDIGDPIPEMVRRAVEWGLARDGAREEMLALLRKIQWQGDISEGAGDDALCPACLGTPQRGHGPDCRLAAFLGT